MLIQQHSLIILQLPVTAAVYSIVHQALQSWIVQPFEENQALGSPDPNGRGGAIYNANELNITNGLFVGNSANRRGGAIFNESIGTVANILNTTFVDNIGQVSGGAIENLDGSVANVKLQHI